MLDIKRRKAETKLIKLRLLTKLHIGQTFSNIEKEYLNKWVESINSANILGKIMYYLVINA